MSRRSRARRPGGRARRNLAWFATLLVVAGGLIVVVGTMNRAPQPIMPPESPEVVAERRSPENLFFAIPELWREVHHPARPEPMMVPSKFNPEVLEPYEPQPGSIGALVYVERTDDDPLLAQYIVDCRPIVERARAEISNGYFLNPSVYERMRLGGADRDALSHAYNLLIASMAHAARQPDTEEQAIEYFSDAAKLLEALASDGGLGDYFGMGILLRRLLQYAVDAAARMESPEHIRALREQVEGITLHTRSLGPYLEFTWRAMDHEAQVRFGSAQREPDAGHGTPNAPSRQNVEAQRGTFNRIIRMAGGWWEAWSFRRHCRLIRKNKDALLRLAEECSSRADFEERIDQDPALRRLYHQLRRHDGGVGRIRSALHDRDDMAATRSTALIALSLELYRRDHGSYPETLDALVPDYLSKIPVTPRSYSMDGTFFYRPEDEGQQDAGDYWLYPGPEERSLGRLNEQSLRHKVFHCPPRKTRDAREPNGQQRQPASAGLQSSSISSSAVGQAPLPTWLRMASLG